MYANRSNGVQISGCEQSRMTAPGIRDGKKAATYLRVSTDEQSASIEAQRLACAVEAAKRGLEVVAEYVDENVSGAISIERRPALKRALKALQAKEADRLIVSKLDRLARNARVALEIDEDYANRHGWAIVFGDIDIDTSTAVGKLQLTQFAAFARFERDRISERTKEALAVKRSQGVRLGRPADLAPAIVARILDEREAGKSLRSIANGLTDEGVPTARGAAIWQVSTIQKVLAGQQAAQILMTRKGK